MRSSEKYTGQTVDLYVILYIFLGGRERNKQMEFTWQSVSRIKT